MYIYDHISLSSSHNEKCLAQKLQRKENIVYVQLFFFSEKRVVYETMWKNILQPDRPHMTIQCMLNACWIPKATNTHSEYVIHIAFSLLQWLRKRISVLLSVYFAVLFRTKMARNSSFRQIGRNNFYSPGWLAASDMESVISSFWNLLRNERKCPNIARHRVKWG